MTRRFLAHLIGLAVLWAAGPAWAGGYVVVLRETGAASASRSCEPGSAPCDVDETNATTWGLVTPQTDASGVEPWSGQRIGPGIRRPLDPFGSVARFHLGEEDGPVDEATDAAYGIAIDDAYADVGCGGAQAAPGPAGLLPFAVAALALLRRRR